MASYPLDQTGLAEFLFPQAGQSLSIHPAGLVASISVIAGTPLDPSYLPLAVHSPVIGTDLAAAVIDRTPELMPIRLAVRQDILSIGSVYLEFPDDKTIPASLNQIGIIPVCFEVACASQGLEHYGMPAAGAAPFLL